MQNQSASVSIHRSSSIETFVMTTLAIFADDTKATKKDPTKSDHLEANANLDTKSGNTRYLWRLYVPQ